MKIVHRPGTQNNQWYVDALLFAQFPIDRLAYALGAEHEITCTYDWNSLYLLEHHLQDQADWRKIWGSKSGVDTKTNLEEIVAYTITYEGNRAFVSQCLYSRTEESRKTGTFVVTNVVKKEIPREGSVTITTGCKARYMLPVTPWAGGDKMNDDRYSFNMKKRIRIWMNLIRCYIG